MIRQTKTENGLVRVSQLFAVFLLLHRLQGRIAGAHLSHVRIGKE